MTADKNLFSKWICFKIYYESGHVNADNEFHEIILLYKKYKLQKVLTFDKNVRLKPVIYQNDQNWKKNLRANFQFDQLIFSKKQI